MKQQRILKVITTSSNKKLIQLETGAHYNMGQKFYEFANILNEETNQIDVYLKCEVNQMCSQFIN